MMAQRRRPLTSKNTLRHTAVASHVSGARQGVAERTRAAGWALAGDQRPFTSGCPWRQAVVGDQEVWRRVRGGQDRCWERSLTCAAESGVPHRSRHYCRCCMSAAVQSARPSFERPPTTIYISAAWLDEHRALSRDSGREMATPAGATQSSLIFPGPRCALEQDRTAQEGLHHS